MHILLLTARFLPSLGGSEIVVDALAREYQKKGHEVFVICPGKPFTRYSDEKLPYQVLRHPFYFSKRSFLNARYRFLKKAYEKHSFDLVHSHAAFPECYLATKLKKQAGIPVVFTSHGADVSSDYRLFKSKRIKDLARKSLEKIDLFCALNTELKNDFLKLTSNKVKVIDVNNGVHLDEYSKSAERIIDQDYILYLGRLCKRKGVEVLLRAYKKSDLRKKLVIAGEGREKARLIKLAKDLGLKDRVVFYGAVSGREKTSLLMHTDLLVVPTLSWEACSLVTLEGLAAGRRVIASDVPGIRHLLPGEHLFKAGSVDDLIRLLNKTNKPFSLKRDFSWQNVSKSYLESFSRL